MTAESTTAALPASSPPAGATGPTKRSSMDAMVDWNLATRVATRVSGPGPQIPGDEARAVVASLRAAAARAEQLVRDVTGLAVPSASDEVTVVDRHAWAAANVAGMRALLVPHLDTLAARTRGLDAGAEQAPRGVLTRATEAAGARVAGLQLGSALGFVGSRVLGQYELLATGAPRAQLMLVAPNIVSAERALGADVNDFRLWVAVHEETHRAQFTAVPWLRGHLQAGIGDFLAASEVDPIKLLGRVPAVLRSLVDIARGKPDASLVDALQTPAQRAVMSRLLAVMTLLEGHADHVMDAVGPKHIPTVAAIRAAFAERRKARNRVDSAIRTAMGLEAKMRQYRDGEHFVSAVVAEVGMKEFNLVWKSPENLPTLAEIADPHSWVDRVVRA